MAWIYLLLAGLMEWGWPVGLKFGVNEKGLQFWPLAGSLVSMICSGALLMVAQRTIPMGTAYAVWTGIGAVGAFVLGILLFKEPAQPMRFFFVGVILVGIIGLKMASDH